MCGAELKPLPEGVQRVAAFLETSGHPHSPVMLDDAARTAQQAADALGVALGQIAKSIVFRRKSDNACVLVVTSGDRRVDERKLEALISPDGKRLARADAEFVKTRTGFSIGGVSPLAHATDVLVLMDRSLMRFEEVWAAAGHPHAVFKSAPQELELLSGAPLVDVAVDLDEETLNRQNAINLIAACARTVSATGDIVPSPCISVCRINAESGLCEGCFRTLEEISGWSRSGPQAKRELWKTILERTGGGGGVVTDELAAAQA
jgi:prolyl-tRNA editing enzyme YbaK/EbsC (Cys-tRNA(Pro) deacylase)/predicted Fe-S protein YdhL (DUF1289 family)